jgi:hypothetical protein
MEICGEHRSCLLIEKKIYLFLSVVRKKKKKKLPRKKRENSGRNSPGKSSRICPKKVPKITVHNPKP